MNSPVPPSGHTPVVSLFDAQGILAVFRGDAEPPRLGVSISITAPELDVARQIVADEDLGHLVQRALRGEDPVLVAVAAAVCKQLQFHPDWAPETKDALEFAWGRNGSFETRWWLSFRLAEYEALGRLSRDELFAFATDVSHWAAWLSKCVDFFGGATRLEESLLGRVSEERTVPWKGWVRVLQCAAIPGKGASATANEIERSLEDDPLTHRALHFVLKVERSDRSRKMDSH